MAFVVGLVGDGAFSQHRRFPCINTLQRGPMEKSNGNRSTGKVIQMKVMTREERHSLGDFVQRAMTHTYLTKRDMDRISKMLARNDPRLRTDPRNAKITSYPTSEIIRDRSDRRNPAPLVPDVGSNPAVGCNATPTPTRHPLQRKTTRVRRLHSSKSSTTTTTTATTTATATATTNKTTTKTKPKTKPKTKTGKEYQTSRTNNAVTPITDPTLARETLVLSHLRLVSALARKEKEKAYSALPVMDLIQEGCMGLIRAANKYDPNKQVSFASYAIPWIQHYMQRAEHNQARMIRMPVHLIKKTNTIAKEKVQLAQKLGRQPGPDEIADALVMNPNEVDFLLSQRELQIKSLDDQPIGPHGESWRSCLEILSASELASADFHFANHHASAESSLMDEQRKEMMNKVLSSVLTVKEQEILKARFGLDDGTPKKLQEIADMRRVTRPNVQQTVVRALKKLQNHREELQPCMDTFDGDI